MYCTVETIHAEGSRSPVIFLHGFPDSPRMFDAYVTAAEQQQPWLRDRRIYAIAFPNRFTNPNYPPLSALAREVLQAEVNTILTGLIADSPTGQIIPVAHDWGATCTWKFLREHPDQHKGIEKLIALSVASSFRFDVWEHGLLALGWSYSTMFGLPYYVRLGPVRRFVTHMITQYGGYESNQNDTLYKDVYHYWYGPLRPFLLPFDFLGLRARPPYLDFKFPVLFIRSPYDQMPSTSGFERELERRPDCRFVLLPNTNHWFPEQHPERVLSEIRTFV